jgi:hypothetical protein
MLRGSAAVVSLMIELIAMAVGLASAFIFVTHVIEAYRAQSEARDRNPATSLSTRDLRSNP